MLIYLETSSPQRVNNIPNLPGALVLTLRKTGKQRCKNPSPSVERGNWGWECDSFALTCARSSWRMLRFVKDCALYVHLTYKDDDLFRNGSVLKTCKMSKVHAHSHEITNKPLRVHTTKTLCLPTWKTNYNADKCASDVKKMKNPRKQNFEGEANNMQLDKEDTRRSN